MFFFIGTSPIKAWYSKMAGWKKNKHHLIEWKHNSDIYLDNFGYNKYSYISPIEWKIQVVSDMQSTGVHEILPYDWHAPEIPLNILNEPKLVPSEPILRHIKTTDLTKANKERPPATMQTHTRTHTSLSSAHAYQQTLISINCGSLGDHLVQPCWLNQWKRTVPVGDLK